MLDLSIFNNRLFSAASPRRVHERTGALRADVRVRLLLPGRAGQLADPGRTQTAPLALGMLIASPLAGIWADRRGSRDARRGDARDARSAWSMTTLSRDERPAGRRYMFIVGIGSGMFNSPNTAAMMGTSPPHRRGIAAGARVLVQNTGAVHLDRVRARGRHLVGAEERAVQRVLGLGQTHLERPADAVHLEHAHRALCLARPRCSGASSWPRRPSFSRGAGRGRPGDHQRRERLMPARRAAPGSESPAKPRVRIGEVAELDRHAPRGRSATTRRSGCCPARADRAQGKHRVYTEADVERVREIIRLRDLLGPLARPAVAAARGRERPRRSSGASSQQTDDPAERRRGSSTRRSGHIATQLELVKHAAARARAARARARATSGAACRSASGARRDRRSRETAGVDRRAMATLSAGPPVHRHRAGLDPGAAAVPDLQRPPELRRRLGADARRDDLLLGDPAGVRPHVRPPLAAVADAARARRSAGSGSRSPASHPATG